MYGGGHYIASTTSKESSLALTKQGKAIHLACVKFGDGKTLPFPPCKKGYYPFGENSQKMVACYLHQSKREKRIQKDLTSGKGRYRLGETTLEPFWNLSYDTNHVEDNVKQDDKPPAMKLKRRKY